MGMTIDDAIAHIMDVICENNTIKHSDLVVFNNEKQALRTAINAMRKYQKIAELYDYWRSGKCEYTISCMENIGKVLKDGENNN